MTPAINTARKANIRHSIHEYAHDPAAESYGLEAATKLQVDPAQVFKTLVVNLDGKALAVGIIPVNSQLSMKRIAGAAGAKKAEMADKQDVQRSTGYVLGGVSPLGQKRLLPTFLDDSARSYETIFVSAGRRGLEIELSSQDLLTVTKGGFATLCQ
ncbi:Cys-tRNA(Pro) deacylase [Microbulbifer hydrolyticus]|uniref:Cys-tRNA(Pro)/Cys-tRNA(Cys) deacylase n=1 Tax=Microbulbifer hydrolyticus TaxID=48074 RepID=A0A6P1T9I9_9GAMM|nr:Cys-tRNA(Pro) deacylase [Microbulbifer hydrolyticus]MBB5210021.1 Cys-tRNA(Pro)/Cys-tRNA(Cys) deacylase [Microbulbifer hydrolyticus]QHQ39454.1 Cys-tRNA(Pro) deacylase [Microbulbifer hydrolyticus]